LGIFWSVRRKCLPKFSRRKTYTCRKIRVNTMKGWNMIVKMKIIKDFIKGIDKLLKQERREIKKKRI